MIIPQGLSFFDIPGKIVEAVLNIKLSKLKSQAFIAICTALLFLLILFSTGSSASAAVRKDVTVAVDSETMSFPEGQEAFIDKNNRTLVPIRFIVEAFDSKYTFTEVNWDEDKQLVTILVQKLETPLSQVERNSARKTAGGVEKLGHEAAEETKVELAIGSSSAFVNDKEFEFDTKARIYNGRTMVPLRFISETLGAEVKWDSSSRRAHIFYLVLPSVNPGVRSDIEPRDNDETMNVLVSNPYEGIDWDTIERHKSTLHSHTDKSDGRLTPTEAIEGYEQLGFNVLSITDHDNIGNPKPTWPWPYVPEGMLPVKGNELSYQHHINSYFTDYYGSSSGSEYESLAAIESQGGLSVFVHPGRYHTPEEWEWYIPYYHNFDSLFALEVYNMGNRYPSDRALWDNLLAHFMPDRPIYGMSNDDMHLKGAMGINWNTLLLEELTAAEVRRALTEGRFFFSYSLDRAAPGIEKVTVENGAIKVHPEYGSVKWVSNGEIIHEGQELEYRNNHSINNYARASVLSEIGRTYTQPFGFETKYDTQNQQ